MNKQLITSTQAEYMVLFSELQKMKKDYESKHAKLMRLEQKLKQDAKLRAIRERKATESLKS